MKEKKAFSPSGSHDDPRTTPRSLRIIVADDDYDAMLTLMMLLREDGHEVRGTPKGAQVPSLAEKFDPDAVLLDINMPDLSGFEIARRIRSRHGDERPLLIAISGVYKQGSDRVLAEIVGFNHHVAKPYDIQQILSLLAPVRLPGGD